MDEQLEELRAKAKKELGHLYSLVPFGKEKHCDGSIQAYMDALESKLATVKK